MTTQSRQDAKTQEHRRVSHFTKGQVRMESRADGSEIIVGYGAVFYDPANAGTEYELWEDMRERIMPGAFDRAIREKHDARGLFNHDPSDLLGRVAAGTMRLSVDSTGLLYEIDKPDTQVGRDVAVSIKRGDLSGSSFAFIARRTVWIEQDGLLIRQVEDLDLYDTGPVTYPAYEATTAGLRSADAESLRAECEAFRRARLAAGDDVAVRSRLVELGL